MCYRAKINTFEDDLSSVDSKVLIDKVCEVLVRINEQPDYWLWRMLEKEIAEALGNCNVSAWIRWVLSLTSHSNFAV